MQWFSFKGILSTSVNVEAVSYVIDIVPKSRSRFITVPGRNGSVVAQDDSLDDIIIKVNCVFPVTSQQELRLTARRIATWLRGSGKLIFWDEPDKARDAYMYNSPKLYDKGGWGQFEVQFRCSPIAKTIAESTASLNTLTEIGGTFSNAGVIIATMPENITASRIEAGIDNVTSLSVIYSFTGGEEILIDLDTHDVFINQLLRNSYITPTSEFFVCPVGEHMVSLGADIDEVWTFLNGSYNYYASWLG